MIESAECLFDKLCLPMNWPQIIYLLIDATSILTSTSFMPLTLLTAPGASASACLNFEGGPSSSSSLLFQRPGRRSFREDE